MNRPRFARASAGAVIAALLVSPLCSLSATAAEVPPADSTVRTTAESAGTDQFLVKFKDTAGTQAAPQDKLLGAQEDELGIDATVLRTVGTGAQVVKVGRPLSEIDAEMFVAGLEADPAVEYAEPDTLVYSTAFVPDDAYLDHQWNLIDDQYGLGMTNAWGTTAGEGTTVAVIDTGIVSHGDLDANILPGYDMISSAAISRDGDGRDANPRDEGDYGDGVRCTADESSSWHGTHVAGTIAAVGGNAIGITGIAPASKVVPVRALGSCGSGYTSDVVDGIIWASGGSVYGVPNNPNRADVINLSLGGSVACSVSYQNAIDQAVSRGSVVVAAAGNEAKDVSLSSPANCANVVSVASTGPSGTLAGYSNFGAGIDVSAPGGDSTWGSQNAILSTVNSGTAGPIEGGAGDDYRFLQGTSMAAPHVSAVAALMLSVNPGLTPASVEKLLKGTTKSTASCWRGCGTGITDATAAVAAAVAGAIPATPAPVVFVDKAGVAEDTYSIPSVRGVDYLLNGRVVAAGTYPGTGTVSVSAAARPTFVLAGDVVQWTHTFDSTTPPADTAAPTLVGSSVDKTAFNLDDGDATFTVSVHLEDATGVAPPTITVTHTNTQQSHGFGSMALTSGTIHDGTWTRTVTIPQGSAPGAWDVSLYPLRDTLGNRSAGFRTIGTITITAPPTPIEVIPAAVVFTDRDGTKDDTYTIPATRGVEYLVGGTVKTAGTYPGTGTVTVTARAITGYVLASGSTTKWTTTFKTAEAPYTPPVVSPFADVSTDQLFYKEMSWLAAQGISTGWAEPDGTRTYRALQPVNRDAMAAFLYRAAGKPAYTPPAVSPFADISTDQLFYKEMSWLTAQGISTGWTEPDGTRTYRALQPVNRDAMAAFLYRAAGKPAYTPPAVSPFADVATDRLFYKEMSWLAAQGISTGWAEPDRTRTYRALQPVNRDAMAAFLYRAAGRP